MNVWVTRHGPCWLPNGPERMALRWTAAEPGFLQYPVLDIDRAQNWQQFTAALARWAGPGSELRLRRRGRQHRLSRRRQLPKRHGFAGDVPVDGSSGDFEWDGFIPFDQLPSAYNPPGGIIATANQNPFPAGLSLSGQRQLSRRPTARCADPRPAFRAQRTGGPADMLAVQTDILFGVQQVSGRPGGGRVRPARRPGIRRSIRRGPAARLERPHG